MPTKDGGYSLADLRAEMARLTGVMMRCNQNFLKREQAVIAKNSHMDKWQINTVLDNDPLIKAYSSGAKTCAVLISGLADVIQAELAMATFYRTHDMGVDERMQVGGQN